MAEQNVITTTVACVYGSYSYLSLYCMPTGKIIFLVFRYNTKYPLKTVLYRSVAEHKIHIVDIYVFWVVDVKIHLHV